MQTRTEERYAGSIFGISSQQALNTAHIMSAGVVSFARGLNDTPKIVAIIIAAQALRIEMGMVLVALAMALGGIVNARRVAVTMSRRITPMNPGQGFSANLVTGLLVLFASRWGLPVSTTHVSVGSLFGIGAASRTANPRVISNIALSWVLTLPVAAVLAGLAYYLLTA
jgi:PiT family inorganic phosphate transporter